MALENGNSFVFAGRQRIITYFPVYVIIKIVGLYIYIYIGIHALKQQNNK